MAATLGAFWLLLGYRYSPESYNSYAITMDTVEFVWLGVALAAAVVVLVALFPKREQWPPLRAIRGSPSLSYRS